MRGTSEQDAAVIEISLASPSMLVIDDDQDFLETVRELFNLRGFDVDIARTPEQATQLLKKNGEDKYQVIAIDINFGDLSEIQGDEYILQNPSLFGKAKTVVITGGSWLTSERREELRRAGIPLLEKSPTLIKRLEEITQKENQKRVGNISNDCHSS